MRSSGLVGFSCSCSAVSMSVAKCLFGIENNLHIILCSNCLELWLSSRGCKRDSGPFYCKILTSRIEITTHLYPIFVKDQIKHATQKLWIASKLVPFLDFGSRNPSG